MFIQQRPNRGSLIMASYDERPDLIKKDWEKAIRKHKREYLKKLNSINEWHEFKYNRALKKAEHIKIENK